MSRSSNFIIHIKSNIYGAGSNSHGQLGLGNTVDTSKNIFTQMVNNTGFTPKSISCGEYHTMVLMTDNSGTIFGTGKNDSGQLGLDNTVDTSKNTLTQMVNNTGFTPKSISCGNNHTIVLMTNGTIYGVGNNYYRQLGTSTTSNINIYTLTEMVNNTGFTPKSISCGYNHIIVLMTNGTIYGVGYNYYGQLGTSTTGNKNTLTEMVNNTGFTPKSISCGDDHTIVLMTNGTIYGVGNNFFGQLGLGNTVDTSKNTLTQMVNNTGFTPKSISCGRMNTMVLMTDNSGTIFGTGYNHYGQLGISNTTHKNTLTQMVNNTGKIPKSIVANEITTVLMTDSTSFVIGSNSSGMLGIGNGASTSLVLNNTNIPTKLLLNNTFYITSPTINSVTNNSNGLNVNITPADGYPIPTYSYSLDNGSTYTPTMQTTSPIIIPTILRVGTQLSISLVATNDEGDTAPSNIVNFTVPFPCFLEGSKILKFNKDTQTEQYVKIETLRKGDLIKTSRSGYKAVSYIGKAQLSDPATNPDIRERLYTFSSKWAIKSEEDLGPLCITGRHNLLHTNLSDSEKEILTLQTGDVYITENKYRVPAYLDARREPYTDNSQVTIWHFALEHPDIEQNYGVYANGILVESSSAEYMTEHSNMELLD